MPLAPRSPRPRIRSPSVTTMTWTSRAPGQLRRTEAMRPRSLDETYRPAACRKICPNDSHASPTVGV